MNYIVMALWAGVSGYYANRKGLNFILWAGAGAILGVFGFLLCMGYASYAAAKGKTSPSMNVNNFNFDKIKNIFKR